MATRDLTAGEAAIVRHFSEKMKRAQNEVLENKEILNALADAFEPTAEGMNLDKLTITYKDDDGADQSG